MAFDAARLRALREEKGLSREVLAEMVGTTSVYIGRLERGEKDNPAFDLVVNLATALGVSCEAFRLAAPVPRGTTALPVEDEPEPPAKKAGKPKGKK